MSAWPSTRTAARSQGEAAIVGIAIVRRHLHGRQVAREAAHKHRIRMRRARVALRAAECLRLIMPKRAMVTKGKAPAALLLEQVVGAHLQP